MVSPPNWSQSKYDEREEFARSVKISLLGVTPTNVASFRPNRDTLGMIGCFGWKIPSEM